MSLVNDMLRDLDQRKEQPAGEGSAAQMSAAYTQEKPAQTRWGLLGGMAGVIGLVLAYLLLVPPASKAPKVYTPPVFDLPVVPQKPAGAPATAVPGTVAPGTVAPVEDAVNAANSAGAAPAAAVPLPVSAAPEVPAITDIRWLARASGQRLQLSLSRAAGYRVEVQRARELVVLLTGFQLQQALPALPSELIDGLQLDVDPEGIRLSLSTLQAVNFRIIPVSGKQELLRIDIVPQPRRDDQAASAATPIVFDRASSAQSKLVQQSGLEAASPAPGIPVADRAATGNETPDTSDVAKGDADAAPDVATRAKSPAANMKRVKALTGPQRDQRQVAEATRLLQENQPQQAQQQLEQHLQQYPRAVQSRVLLASLLVSLNRLSEAQQQLDAGLALTPQQTDLRRIKARLLLQVGVEDEALALLGEPGPGMENDAVFYQLRATLLQRANRFDDAAQVYYRLLQVDAGQASWWLGLGMALEGGGRAGEARQAYTNVLDIPGVAAPLTRYAQERLRLLKR